MITLFVSILLAGCSSFSDKKETVSVAVEEKATGNNQQVKGETNIPESQETSKVEGLQEDIQEMTYDQLLPNIIGYCWQYYGSVDYKRRESIVDIQEVEGTKSITISGEIDNEPTGIGRDLSFQKQYQVNNKGILLNHKEKSITTEFYLLKGPLQLGNTWEHSWYEGSTAQSEIIALDDKKVTIRTERLDLETVKSYRLQGAEVTLELGKGIIKEKMLIKDNVELYTGLDSYGVGIFEWLGYYTLESKDERTGHMMIYKMNDDELAYDIYIKTGEGYDKEVGLQKTGKVQGNIAIFEKDITVGNGSKETYKVSAILEKNGNTIKVTTDKISPEYNGSSIKVDGIYKKEK